MTMNCSIQPRSPRSRAYYVNDRPAHCPADFEEPACRDDVPPSPSLAVAQGTLTSRGPTVDPVWLPGGGPVTVVRGRRGWNWGTKGDTADPGVSAGEVARAVSLGAGALAVTAFLAVGR